MNKRQKKKFRTKVLGLFSVKSLTPDEFVQRMENFYRANGISYEIVRDKDSVTFSITVKPVEVLPSIEMDVVL